MNALQQFGRAVGGALAGLAASIGGNDRPPPRPVPAVVMPDTTPLPRPRPDLSTDLVEADIGAEVVPEATTTVAALGIPLPPPRPDDVTVGEGDALPPGGDVIPPAERLAFAAPEPGEPAPGELVPFTAVVAPEALPPGEDHAGGLGGDVAEAGDAQVGDVILPLPRPRPEYEVAALPPTPAAPALIARLNDNPPSPACLARLRAMGVAFEVLEPVATELGCGTAQPLLVRALGNGAVELNPPATLDCDMAETLANWMEGEVQPSATEAFEAEVTGLRVAASYSCRGVNGASSGPLSEHAYANAIDVSAFEIGGESDIEVRAQDDPETPTAEFLADIRGAACEHFHTVLGPGSDAAHWNHFHLDLAPRGRNGDSRFCQ